MNYLTVYNSLHIQRYPKCPKGWASFYLSTNLIPKIGRHFYPARYGVDVAFLLYVAFQQCHFLQ